MFAEVLHDPEPLADRSPPAAKVLIIDDDEAMVDVLSHRLSHQGFTPITADTGRAGLAKARKERPSLILLDLRLPDTDGLTICEELAESDQTWDIPVIIVSGMERPDIIRRCRRAGCRYYLRKPYDPNALLVLIQHALGRGH